MFSLIKFFWCTILIQILFTILFISLVFFVLMGISAEGEVFKGVFWGFFAWSIFILGPYYVLKGIKNFLIKIFK